MPLTPSIEDSSYSPQFSSTPSDVTIQRFFPQPSPKSKPPASYIPFLDRLRALPELRPIPWRPGQELPRERSFDSPRVQQRGATLLSTRGAIASAACEHCSSGYGRFGLCVTLPQWFQGACSSWIFTSKGNRCSLRTQISGKGPSYCELFATTRTIQTSSNHIQDTSTQPTKPPPERQRTSAAPIQASVATTPAPYTSLDLDMRLQADIAREQSPMDPDPDSELEAYVKRRQSQPNVARPRGPSKSTVPCFQKYNEEHGSGTLPDLSGATNHMRRVETSTPMSAAGGSNTYCRDERLQVIDTLPRATRRQVYSIISGLQGSIDHLQKQLDALKRLMGMNEENRMP
ncbi:hypothetical protein JHW43_000831 [Diplocarpon mali]|nr:hypothetical protein JHW43_000831 [Diplocarpon mali]